MTGGYRSTLLLFALVTGTNILLCDTADPSTEVYVSDRHGNVVYKDGTVVYVSPLPVGNANYSTSADYDTKGLDTLYAMARSLVKDVMSEPFPFDLLEDIAKGKFSLSKDYAEVVKQLVGLGVCVVIGVLFVVAFIIGGICFCCCRCCCGNCGGTGIQVYKEKERCMRMGLSQALVLMLICVFSAAVCVYITNDTFTDALHFTNDSLVSNIGDIGRFLNNTGFRFQYVVTDMYDLVHSALQKDLSNLGELAETDIFASLRVPKVLEDISSLDQHLRTLSDELNQTMYDVIGLQNAASILSTKLSDLADDIDVTSSSCASSCSPNLCFTLDTNTLRNAAINTSSLPDLNSTLAEVDGIIVRNNFTDLALSAEASLEAISETIDNAANDIKTAVNSSLMAYYKLIHGLSDGVFKGMTQAFPTQKLIDESTDIVNTVLDYDTYRRYIGIALTYVFMVLVLLFTVGIVLGVAFYDGTALPTERRGGSNLGGNILLLGVGLTFLLGALFMVLAVLTFLFGALLEKGCEPVENLNYFKEFLDKGKAPGYSLSDITLGIKDFQLSTYDVLLGCRADQTPWTVLKMGEVVPLEKYLVYFNYLGDLGKELAKMQSLDVSMFKIVDSSLADGFNEVKDIGPADVDFVSINKVLLEEPLLINASATLVTMRMIQDTCRNPVQAQWTSFVTRMESLVEHEVPAVKEALVKLTESSTALQTSLTTFAALTASVIADANRVDYQIKFNMTSILLKSSVGLAGKMLSYVDSYASEVVFVIYNSLGNCRPLWNLYKSVSVVLCNYGVDTLNGYWFSIGWGLFFFLPIVVVAAKLANHYKTMDAAAGYEEFDDLDVKEMETRDPYRTGTTSDSNVSTKM